MAHRNLYHEASSRAASEIDYILREEESKKQQADIPMVSVERALRGERLYDVTETRDVTRVLFISQDDGLLNPTTQSLDGYVNLSDLFEEVHILILRQGIVSKFPSLRVADNVWLYTAAAKARWEMPAAGRRMVDLHLVFAGGFRPDLIVARDPFESALLALRLAKQYACPLQLHLLEDIYSKKFKRSAQGGFWRRLLARYTIPRFSSVRTMTDGLLAKVARRHQIQDLAMLPRFQNYESILSSQERVDLKTKYPPYTFFILYVGALGHQSRCHEAIDGARFALSEYNIGFLILGDGPARGEFEKRAATLHIAPQVIFAGKTANTTPYFKSADLLVVTDTDAASEEVVLKAAAAGIPLVMTVTERRRDVFVDGQSAFLCEPGDVQGITDAINELLQNPNLRKAFSVRGQAIICEQFHHSLREYAEAYRTTIEEAFFAGEAGEGEVSKKLVEDEQE